MTIKVWRNNDCTSTISILLNLFSNFFQLFYNLLAVNCLSSCLTTHITVLKITIVFLWCATILWILIKTIILKCDLNKTQCPRDIQWATSNHRWVIPSKWVNSPCISNNSNGLSSKTLKCTSNSRCKCNNNSKWALLSNRDLEFIKPWILWVQTCRS